MGRGNVLIATERAHSVAVVGPTQSGKTTSVAVPAILGWEGSVLACSVKGDLLKDTVAWRRSVGPVWCFDPLGHSGEPPCPWSPIRHAATWAGARRMAADLTEVTRREGTSADGEFWYATAAKLLAPLLHAAALSGGAMSDVVRWVDTQEVAEVAAILEGSATPAALQAARASWQRDERQRSSVYTTAETVLEPFADAAFSDVGRPDEEIDPGRLAVSPATLYLCAPAHDQRRLRNVFVALVKQVLEAAFERAGATGRPLDPPLLVVLDEAANIAPLADLDVLAATCAGHGVQLVTVWQDLAQVHARYGETAATVINNHRAKFFLSGIADPTTLEQASRLIGDEHRPVPSVTRGAQGEHSTTTSEVTRPLLAPDALRRLTPGGGVLVYGSFPPARLDLRPWWSDPVLAPRGAPAVAAAPPTLSRSAWERPGRVVLRGRLRSGRRRLVG